MRIPDTTLVAQQFVQEKSKHDADAFFVDETGGYGAGVIDTMRAAGRKSWAFSSVGQPVIRGISTSAADVFRAGRVGQGRRGAAVGS